MFYKRDIVFAPIEVWPGTPNNDPKKSRFEASYSQTRELLERELGNLRADHVVLQVYLKDSLIRRDGFMRASARPSRPGVILCFGSRVGPLQYPCDTYRFWEHNLRAIALSLEALRAVDRHGVTSANHEQYTGWKALPAPSGNGAAERRAAAEVIAAYTGGDPERMLVSDEYLRKSYRVAAMALHPDRSTGSHEAFTRLQEAKAALGL